jgi:hypothetical protein
LKEAQAEAAFQRLAPNFSLKLFKAFLPYKNPVDIARTIESLRKAGLK